MGYREQVKQAVQFFLGTHSQQLVHLSDIFDFRRETLVYIQNQGFQQVHLRIIPEMIPFSRAGILDDDIRQDLSHCLRPVNLHKTVPAVGVFRVDQVETFDGIAFILQIHGHTFIEFGFRIGNDETFSRSVNPACHALENGVSDIGTALHGTAGAVNSHIPIHIGVVRQADSLAIQLA